MRPHQARASCRTRGFQTGNRPGRSGYRQHGVRHQNHMGPWLTEMRVHTPLAVLAWWFVHRPHPTCRCALTGTCGIRLQQHNPNQQCLAPSVAARAAFAGSFQCEKPTEALNASVWHGLVFDDFDGARARAAAAASPNKPPSPWVTRWCAVKSAAALARRMRSTMRIEVRRAKPA